jgi:hypothetical protein
VRLVGVGARAEREQDRCGAENQSATGLRTLTSTSLDGRAIEGIEPVPSALKRAASGRAPVNS